LAPTVNFALNAFLPTGLQWKIY